jgi:hypothetical protein
VRTDDQGRFSVANLPIGKYEVSPEYANGLGPSAPVTVSARDKGCAEVHFSAQSDGIVDGNIFKADLTPASGPYTRRKRIEEGQTPNWAQDLYLDTTDSAGNFHFEPVQPGAYVLGANMDFPTQGSSFKYKNFCSGQARQEQAEIIHVVGAQHKFHRSIFSDVRVSATPS